MPAWMNQRMVLGGRSEAVGTANERKGAWTPSFWALIFSIAVHFVILAVFGVVKFSQCTGRLGKRPAPTARISRLTRLTQAIPVVPKPKVNRASEHRFVRSPERLSPANSIFDSVAPATQNPENLARSSVSRSTLISTNADLSRRIEFFGSFTDKRKVCYVVDSSGSMRGVFERVRQELKESIEQLQADQYFCVIFFGGDGLGQFGEGRLVRASNKVKSAAYDFIDSVRPQGHTNALAALESAMQIRDAGGLGPSIVYFLTDGFELTGEGGTKFVEQTAGLQRRFAPAARIHAIAFWPQRRDLKVLEAIAKRTGGEVVIVADGDASPSAVLGVLPD